MTVRSGRRILKANEHSRRTRLTHVTARGGVRMVDVAAKPVTVRTAVAEAVVCMRPAALTLIRRKAAAKGDVLVTAQIAGILAAKRTAQIIPLCHPLTITSIDVTCTPSGSRRVHVVCRVSCTERTGAEMEALTGAAVAALTIYDMCKAADRAMTIQDLRLVEKAGGRSGHYRRTAQ